MDKIRNYLFAKEETNAAVFMWIFFGMAMEASSWFWAGFFVFCVICLNQTAEK